MKKVVILMILVLSMLSINIFADSAKDILKQLSDSMKTFKTAKQSYELIVEKNGNKSIKELDIYVLIYEENGETKNKTILRINSPVDVRNTTVLNLSEDEQYVYLPALRKVKRISGSSKDENFLDTDIKYSDMNLITGDIEDDENSKIISEDENNWKIQITNDDENVDYSRVEMIILKKEMMLEQAYFYNKKGELIKIMKSQDLIKEGKNKFWKKIELQNIQNDTKTIMNYLEAEYDIPITDRFFNKLNISNPILVYR